MTTITENAWNEQDGLQNKPGYRSEDDTALNSVRNSAVDPDDEDDLEDDDFDDDDLDYDDEDFDDDDLDDDDLDEDDDGYKRVGGAATTGEATGVEKSYDADGNETPEEGQAHTEKESYYDRTEVEQQSSADEASFSERNDVEPPTPHEFPATGTHTEANFESRPLGRTTGRMIGHEPGTENI